MNELEIQTAQAAHKDWDSLSVFVPSVNRSMSYSDFVAKLFKADTDQVEFCHMGLGVSGEAGELADALKKHAIYGKELDRKNVIEELGDLRFYMQALMNKLAITESDVLQHNANKLSKRYPAGQYSDTAAIARLDKVGEDTPDTFFNPNNIDDWVATEIKHIWYSFSAKVYVFSDEAGQFDTTPYTTEAQAMSALKNYIENVLEPKPLNLELSQKQQGNES